MSVVGKFGRKSEADGYRSSTCICKCIDLPENSSWLSGEFSGLNTKTKTFIPGSSFDVGAFLVVSLYG